MFKVFTEFKGVRRGAKYPNRLLVVKSIGVRELNYLGCDLASGCQIIALDQQIARHL
jgi:hypothetical protein